MQNQQERKKNHKKFVADNSISIELLFSSFAAFPLAASLENCNKKKAKKEKFHWGIRKKPTAVKHPNIMLQMYSPHDIVYAYQLAYLCS